MNMKVIDRLSIQDLLSKHNNNPTHALHYEVTYRNFENIKTLIDIGADANDVFIMRIANGDFIQAYDLLQLGCIDIHYNNEIFLKKCCYNEWNISCIEWLLDHGADPSVDNYEIIKTMLEKINYLKSSNSFFSIYEHRVYPMSMESAQYKQERIERLETMLYVLEKHAGYKAISYKRDAYRYINIENLYV